MSMAKRVEQLRKGWNIECSRERLKRLYKENRVVYRRSYYTMKASKDENEAKKERKAFAELLKNIKESGAPILYAGKTSDHVVTITFPFR